MRVADQISMIFPQNVSRETWGAKCSSWNTNSRCSSWNFERCNRGVSGQLETRGWLFDSTIRSGGG